MNILADENIDEQIIETLCKNGHNVLYVGEMSPSISDKVVLSNAFLLFFSQQVSFVVIGYISKLC